MAMKINSLEIENVKRVKAVRLEPGENGLTVIGGKNRQGKTSILDTIAWALGGDKYRPANPAREGSVIPPRIYIRMNNGLVVERKGKNSSLTVTDPEGKKAGQQLLNCFVEQLALDLPKFMNASDKEKAGTLLKIIGVEDQLATLEAKESELYNTRLVVGRTAEQKKKFAEEQTYYPDAPKELVSAAELIKQQQEILAKNGENQRKREARDRYNRELAEAQIAFDKAKARLAEAEENAAIARKSAENLQDESTAELETSIANIDEINRKVRANLDKDKAEEDANYYADQYQKLTIDIEKVRQDKADLLRNADLPLPGLSVKDGSLTYKGQVWSDMSGSEQLMVATSIVRRLNPRCGFVLIDKLEQMDTDTMREFGTWLEAEGLQAIATRVSASDDECTIIIEDGYVKGAEEPQEEPEKAQQPQTNKKWKAGIF